MLCIYRPAFLDGLVTVAGLCIVLNGPPKQRGPAAPWVVHRTNQSIVILAPDVAAIAHSHKILDAHGAHNMAPSPAVKPAWCTYATLNTEAEVAL